MSRVEPFPIAHGHVARSADISGQHNTRTSQRRSAEIYSLCSVIRGTSIVLE